MSVRQFDSDTIRFMSKIVVGKNKLFGRGIFAKKDIKRKSIIEISPVIVFDKTDSKKILNTKLASYIYDWSKKNCFALALGSGSLFNHSYSANARYEMDYKKKIIRFIAHKDIKKGEEILINYNGNIECKDKLWFEDLGAKK